jgi:HTH-type transcriptional regulator / antitoxin HipB
LGLTLFVVALNIILFVTALRAIFMIVHSTKELAEYIKDHRKRERLRQAEVSDRVGLRQMTVSAFENKPESTKLETLFRLLSALDLELHVMPKETKIKDDQGWNEEW